ncbi:hypothetical protein [Crossiella equi]|uniref:hypothetical protein n=1 Tax=Crossiella equi TaxID=130796 RepID=UPI001AE53953
MPVLAAGPRLAGHLPERSNIRAFQRRFRPFGTTPVRDADVLEFVFGRPRVVRDLDSLPRETRLERAVGDHLRAGGHWGQGCGWLALWVRHSNCAIRRIPRPLAVLIPSVPLAVGQAVHLWVILPARISLRG